MWIFVSWPEVVPCLLTLHISGTSPCRTNPAQWKFNWTYYSAVHLFRFEFRITGKGMRYSIVRLQLYYSHMH